MAHKGIRHLGMAESTALAYDQVGFDLMSIDHNQVASEDYKIFKAGSGQNVNNIIFLDIPTNGTAHWIGIHNCGTVNAETVSVQAVTLGAGDNFSKSQSAFDGSELARYIEILPGDVVYGKFTDVAIVKTASGSPVAYVDILRLIRGA